jgi:hypothetical protein
VQWLLESLWAILRGYKKDTVKCPNTRCQPIGEEAELLSDNWQKRGNFRPFSLKRCIFVYIYFKSKELWKLLKMLSGSSPFFALYNHTTFSQIQTGARVPLKRVLTSPV